ncbi:hypothetical protein FRX31_027178 [Thalictrum thalictroides]|uniref:Uncharacterized protein n=1 Tax=Thalictrum thalictroides TaxID=46969 RepID=A0A7J6VG89_THATH|nr:hypothetical protein FRX31_027178 [Thalictrum thalictroides]
MVLNFFHLQKAKFFKFGSGIQTRHIEEVCPEEEMHIEDNKFQEWKEEKLRESEKMKEMLTLSILTDSQLVSYDFGESEGIQEVKETNKAMSQEDGEKSMEMMAFVVAKVKETEAVMQGRNLNNKGEDGGNHQKAEWLFLMDISPQVIDKAQTNQAQSISMEDVSGALGTGSKVIIPTLDKNQNEPTCKKKMFYEDADSQNPISKPDPVSNLDQISYHVDQSIFKIPNVIPNSSVTKKPNFSQLPTNNSTQEPVFPISNLQTDISTKQCSQSSDSSFTKKVISLEGDWGAVSKKRRVELTNCLERDGGEEVLNKEGENKRSREEEEI